MSWFAETRKIPSEKNGLITATRRFGKWQITVDGCEQTGEEVHEIWKYALSVAREYRGIDPVKNILLLGLGAGGEIKNYYRAFKNVHITAIEHDGEMVRLAKNLGLWKPFPFPQVIEDDAKSTLGRLAGTFDIVVVDLFKGPVPSPLSRDEDFLSSLEKKLAHNGLLLVNTYKDAALLDSFEKRFFKLRTWRYGLNHIGLFSKNTALAAFAAGYMPVREWPEVNTLTGVPGFFGPAHVGEKQEAYYWKLWPFSFEKYRGDEEPDIIPLPPGKRMPVRLIMWQRLKRSGIPDNWFAFSARPAYKIGFAPVVPEYWKTWSENARRFRRKWRESYLGPTYRIEEVTFDEFKVSYMKSTLPPTLKGAMLWEMRMRMRNAETPVQFFGVKRISTGEVVAGLSSLQSSRLPIRYYLGGFFLKSVSKEPVMAGLFDFWFEKSLAEGVGFIDFGNFWKPGDESDWKGFSSFKAKFDPTYFFFPPLLYQFRTGKRR